LPCAPGVGCFTSGRLLCAASCWACCPHCWLTCVEVCMKLCTLGGQASTPLFSSFCRPFAKPSLPRLYRPRHWSLGVPGTLRAQFHTPERCQCRVQFHTPGHSDEAACELGASCFTSGSLLCAASCLACFAHCWPTCVEVGVKLCTLAGQASAPLFSSFRSPFAKPSLPTLYRARHWSLGVPGALRAVSPRSREVPSLLPLQRGAR
jgi:hypothetical protein